MTQVTKPNRPLGTDTRSIEAILADFDAITGVINGNLDVTNMSATGAQNFLQPGDLIVSAAGVRAGCLLCDGRAISRVTYAALFAAIGTTFGAGDTTSTFNIPDYRGRVIMAAGQSTAVGATAHNAGDKIGSETHTHSVPSTAINMSGAIAAVSAHSHNLSTNGYASVQVVSNGAIVGALAGSFTGTNRAPTAAGVADTSTHSGTALGGATDSGGAQFAPLGGTLNTPAMTTGSPSSSAMPPILVANVFIKT